MQVKTHTEEIWKMICVENNLFYPMHFVIVGSLTIISRNEFEKSKSTW